ncbi:MAG TPA: tetratricopeptide repeat protein [Pirellulales bacterium]|nr:tetratricopeptide repeat protein [Pirellulales bacterium]
MQEQSIFIEALEKNDPSERAAFLDLACAGAPDLRRRIERLLERHQEDDSLLEPRQLSLVATVDRPIAEQPGETIGPYKLLEQIGEGGFGVVFMAEQQQPVRRKVALKVLKPGMDTRQVVARFEAERQALALMDHPNIAHVFDGGTTDAGRPFFVMELVRGVPITEFCDQSCLAIRQRLELFVDVCQAVQHAHQKGIIHRDIKPTNVMVTLHDGQPVVKVIDFGVAKALGQQLTEKTLFTNFAQLIGTPLYMSPEQAEMSGLDVDTRSDVYSLGVLLYELLTGTTPFENERLSQVGYDEMRRIIREEEPCKPSMRISTVGKLATTACQQRQSDPRKLSQLFRGELDWIVMKCLEKDRDRRYETANGLAADVRRYLKDEPVLAGPPSPWYRLRKFAWRNRLGVAAALSILLLILSLGVVVGWQRKLANEQTAREVALNEKVNRDLDEADALIEQDRWPEALAIVQRTEKLLAAAGRQESPTRVAELYEDLAVVEQLENIYARPKGDVIFPGHEEDNAFVKAFEQAGIDVATLPIAEAGERIRARRIRRELVRGLDFWSLARKYANNQGRPAWKRLLEIAKAADQDAWRNQLRDALEAEDSKGLQALAASADVLHLPPQTLVLLGRTLANMGASEQAVALLRQAHRRFPADLWINNTLGWQCLVGLHPAQPEDSLRYYTAALALRPGNSRIMSEVGNALIEKGSRKEAMAVLDVAIELDAKNNLAWFYRARCHSWLGDNTNAIADSSMAIELDPQWSAAWVARADAQRHLRQYDKALADCNKAIELDDKFWWAWDVRGLTYHHLHRDDEALADMNRAVDLAPENLWVRNDRAPLYIALEQYDKALADYSKAIELGDRNADVLNQMAWLIVSCADGGFRDANKYKAVQLAMEAVALAPAAGFYRNTLGKAHYRAGNWQEAVAALEKSMELCNGGDSFDWFFLAMAHWQLGDKEVARKWYNAAALWMDEYAPGDVQLRRFRDEAAALLSVTANQPRRQSADADWEIWTLVREAQPDSVAARLWRGNKYGRLALWDLGAAELAKAVQFQAPPSTRLWFLHALLRVYVGDAEGYRKAATQMPQQFQHESSNELARALTLAPVPDVDLDWAAAQAELSVKNEGGPWSHNALGLVHYRAGKYEQALGPLRDALRLDSHWRYAIVSHSVLAMAYHRLGWAAEARQALTEADRKVDQWRESLLGLSLEPAGNTWWDLLEGLILYREAKIMLEGSPPPDDPRPIVARAHAFAALAERDKADEACARAVELGVKNFGVRLACARIHAELHEYEKALADFCEAIELDPNSAAAWNERGAAYANVHEYDKAIADYARAIELDQNNVFLWYCHALLRCGTSDPEGYRNDCTAMLERFGKSEDRATANLLVWTCVLAPEAVSNPALAAQVAEKAMTNDPNNQSCLNMLGATLYRAGRFDEAAKRLSEANTATPDPFTSSVYTWLFLAMTHHRLGHADEARQWLDKAVQAIDTAGQEVVQRDKEPSGKPHEIKAASPLSWNRALTFQLLRREAQDLIMKPSTETGP